jgi:hypothetical protein
MEHPEFKIYARQAKNLWFKNKKMGGCAAHFLIFERAS